MVVDALRRLGGVPDPDVTAGPTLPAEGYRTTVRVAVDGGDPRTVTATAAGTWSVDLEGLGTGEHTVRATQTVAGSTSAPVSTTFTVAAGAALTVDTPADGDTVTVPAGTTTTSVPVSGPVASSSMRRLSNEP